MNAIDLIHIADNAAVTQHRLCGRAAPVYVVGDWTGGTRTVDLRRFFAGDETKELLNGFLRSLLRDPNACGGVMVAESWVVHTKVSPGEKAPPLECRPKHHHARQSAIFYVAEVKRADGSIEHATGMRLIAADRSLGDLDASALDPREHLSAEALSDSRQLGLGVMPAGWRAS